METITLSPIAQVEGTPFTPSSSSPSPSQGSTTESDAEQQTRQKVQDMLMAKQRMGKENSPAGKDGGNVSQGGGQGAGKKPTKMV